MARLESQQPPHPEQADQPHHLRIPLALVIGRYFFYLLVGSLIVIGAPLAALTGQMRSGSIVPANYGEVHLDDVAETLSTQTTFNADAIPSAYRYALFTSTDSIASSDMNASQIEFARTVTASRASSADSTYRYGSEQCYQTKNEPVGRSGASSWPTRLEYSHRKKQCGADR